MKKHHLKVLVPGIFVATALALAGGVGAQTPPPAETPPAVAKTPASPMPAHHQMDSTEKAARSMMMEMQPAMMAHMMRHKEMKRGAEDALKCPMMTADDAPKTGTEKN
jgi:hypothetical protein